MENNKQNINELYKFDEKTNLKNDIQNLKSKYVIRIKQPSFYIKFLHDRLPVLDWLPKYKIKQFLLADIFAGIIVGIMNIPQGMGYALLAALEPVNGLYISFFPLIIYAFLGTSRHLAIGAIAIVSLLSGQCITEMTNRYALSLNSINKTVTTNSTSNDDLLRIYRVQVATSLTLLVGLIQLLMGLTGLGFITKYFSDSFNSAYTSGCAIHVLVSQIQSLFGFKNITRYEGILNIPKTLFLLASNIPKTNIATLVLSIICIVYLILFKELLNPLIKKIIKVEFPSELLLVIITTLLSYFCNFNTKFSISIVNKIPSGMPTPQIPVVSFWREIFMNAIIISIIAFSINASMSVLFSTKHKYKTNSTQELYAYGTSNIFSSFFSCYPSAASLSRSSVLESVGGKTQLSSLISALIMLVVILFIGPLFENLPKACLACVIVVALKGLLLQVKDCYKYWNINKIECFVWVLTYLSVVLLDVDIGLIVGVSVSIVIIVVKDQFFHIKTIAKYKNNYLDDKLVSLANPSDSVNIERIENDSRFKIFRIENSIYFATADSFKEKVISKYDKSIDLKSEETKIKFVKSSSINSDDNKTNPSTSISVETDHNSIDNYINISKLPDLILDFSAVNYVDTNGVKAIQQLIDFYSLKSVNVFICNSQENFLKLLYKMKLLEKFEKNLYLTIDDVLISNNN